MGLGTSDFITKPFNSINILEAITEALSITYMDRMIMASDANEIQVTCFRLGVDFFAVDIMRIKEIIRPQKLSALPNSPSFIDGILNLRGEVVPVVDLRKRFAFLPRDVDCDSRLLIVKVAGQLLGLVVDDVTEVLAVPVSEIKPPPKVMSTVDSLYIIGVCLVKDTLVMLLDVDKILTQHESHELRDIHGAANQ